MAAWRFISVPKTRASGRRAIAPPHSRSTAGFVFAQILFAAQPAFDLTLELTAGLLEPARHTRWMLVEHPGDFPQREVFQVVVAQSQTVAWLQCAERLAKGRAERAHVAKAIGVRRIALGRRLVRAALQRPGQTPRALNQQSGVRAPRAARSQANYVHRVNKQRAALLRSRVHPGKSAHIESARSRAAGSSWVNACAAPYSACRWVSIKPSHARSWPGRRRVRAKSSALSLSR